MCRKVTCKQCQRPTWAGCGAHVEQVLGDIPEEDRCPGHLSTIPSVIGTPKRTSSASRLLHKLTKRS